jgi:hypothetical protein
VRHLSMVLIGLFYRLLRDRRAIGRIGDKPGIAD